MNIADIARQLGHGELSQLAIGKALLNTPTLDHVSQVVDSVNLGLTAIYKRFQLKEGRLKVMLFPAVEVYPLRDAAVLKVEKVLTDTNEPLALNDSADSLSCFTPSARVLRIPKLMAEQSASLPEKYRTTTLEVLYRANHPLFVPGEVFTGGLENYEMELPDAYLQALLYFVASRFHNPVGMTNEFHAGNSYFAKYELECKALELENLETDQGASNTRLSRGGWV